MWYKMKTLHILNNWVCDDKGNTCPGVVFIDMMLLLERKQNSLTSCETLNLREENELNRLHWPVTCRRGLVSSGSKGFRMSRAGMGDALKLGPTQRGKHYASSSLLCCSLGLDLMLTSDSRLYFCSPQSWPNVSVVIATGPQPKPWDLLMRLVKVQVGLAFPVGLLI